MLFTLYESLIIHKNTALTVKRLNLYSVLVMNGFTVLNIQVLSKLLILYSQFLPAKHVFSYHLLKIH